MGAPLVLAGGALLLLLGYLVAVPLVMLLISAFKPNGYPLEPGFTLDHVVKAFADPVLPDLIVNTLSFSLGSTAFALILGLLLAFLLERSDIPLRNLWRGAAILPMAIPPMLLAMAWALLLSPRIGAINVLANSWFGARPGLFNIYSMGGMVFVEGIALAPSAYLMLAAPVAHLSAAMEEAAALCGAGPLRRLRRVILPMLAPAIVSAAIYLFIVGLVVFDVPGSIGIPAKIFVLSTHVYNLAHNPPDSHPAFGEIGALSFIFLFALAALGLAYRRLGREGRRFVTITGKASAPRLWRLGAWRWPVALAVAAYFLLAILLPLAILVWTSLLPYQARFSPALIEAMNTSNYVTFLRNARSFEALRNSVLVALVSASLVVLLSFAVAGYIHRTRGPWRSGIDLLAFAPMAIPGVMIGMALIFVYLSLDALPIYGSVWIIVIAFLTEYLAYGTRSANGVAVQIHPELEEAGRMSGANAWTIQRRILVPLVLPAILAVWVWVFAHALRALSAPLMLQGRDNTVLVTLLWGYWNTGEVTIAAAIGVVLVGLLLIATAAWRFAASRGMPHAA